MKTIFIGTIGIHIHVFMNTKTTQYSLFGQEIQEQKLQTCKIVFNSCVTHYGSSRSDWIIGPLCKKAVDFHGELLSILEKEKV